MGSVFSQLDLVIPPVVLDDNFYFTLKKIAERRELKTFLEIGSSSGVGSTRALVDGMRLRESNDAHLFCMEVSRARYINLFKTYEQDEFVFPYNLSSDIGFPIERGGWEFLQFNIHQLETCRP